MITVYGIKNCDTVKKARAWLESEGIEYRFHDFRVDGLDKATLAGWIAEQGRYVVINRRGTTWRKLSDADKNVQSDADALLLAQPAMIKRPVFDLGDRRLVGFTDTERAALKSP
jgi:arsenate reductase (glutaredoxin)